MGKNKGTRAIANPEIWRIIMKNLPGKNEFWIEAGQITRATFYGWKGGMHFPNKNSLESFLNVLNDRLSDLEKDRIVNLVLLELGVDAKSDDRRILEESARANFVDFYMQALNNKLSRASYLCGIASVNGLSMKKMLYKVLEYKFRNWLSSEDLISLGYTEILERMVFFIYIKNQGETLPPVIFSYQPESTSLEDERASLRAVEDQYGEDCLLHIAVTLHDVDDDIYKKELKRKHGAYIRMISDEDMQNVEIMDAYLSLKGGLSNEYDINRRAEIIFRKFLECSYQIYKEVLCYEYNAEDLKNVFFQSNIGIGNYPYAMRRAISFEKNLIANELKALQERRGKRLDCMIDLNCLGGLYGLRLHSYAKEVLCIDTSIRVIRAIDETIIAHNQKNPDMEIVNVRTGLFRVDSGNMLDNESLANKADCIMIGFGTMSYMKSPDIFLRKLSVWLKQDGIIFLSCFNPDALSIKMKKYENLDYVYDTYHQRFIYRHSKTNIPVPVRMFTFHEFKNLVIKYFDLSGDKMWSYPVISSIVPINEDQPGSDIIKEVDKVSATHTQYRLSVGNYNMVLARHYQSQYRSDLYVKTKSVMVDRKIECKEIQHHAFVSRKTLMEELKEKGINIWNNFIKCIMIKDSSDTKPQYYMILIPFGKRFSWDFLKYYYRKMFRIYRQTKIKFCQEKELRDMGLFVGCICPFSYLILKESYDIELLYDHSLKQPEYDALYTYSGRNDVTYKIPRETLEKYLEEMGAKTCRI